MSIKFALLFENGPATFTEFVFGNTVDLFFLNSLVEFG